MSDTPENKPDLWHYIGMLIAAAILVPLGMYLKANYSRDVGEFIISLFS